MRIFPRLVAVSVAAVMVLALATNVQAARRSSLHGNLLLEDVTDVFAMPQLLQQYRNLIRIHMGADAETGDGMLIFGTDAMAFGIVAHRGDNTSPFAGLRLAADGVAGALLGGARGFSYTANSPDFPRPHNIVDLLFSLNMGDTAGLGFRLGLANGGSSVTPDGGDSAGDSQTSINFGAGYSTFGEDSMRMDLSLNLSVGLGSTDSVQTAEGDSVTGSDIGIQLNGRFYLPMEEMVDLGILGGLNLNFASVDPASRFALGAIVGAGPVYRLGKARISAYGFLAFRTSTQDPNTDVDDNETTTTNLTIPGVHMAMEVDLLEWLRFRAGLEYAWGIRGTSTSTVSESTREGSFGWSGGFGFVVDQFRLDLALENAWFTNGPSFLGQESRLAGHLAASYSF